MTSDIKKSELRGVVFVTAHNAGQLSDERARLIDEFDVATYRPLLEKALAARIQADETGSVGGGARDARWLREALANLEFILSR